MKIENGIISDCVVVKDAKIRENENTQQHTIKITLDFDGMPIEKVLQKAAETYIINAAAKLRKMGDGYIAKHPEMTIKVAEFFSGRQIGPKIVTKQDVDKFIETASPEELERMLEQLKAKKNNK